MLALCCLLAADQDAEARRAHRGKIKTARRRPSPNSPASRIRPGRCAGRTRASSRSRGTRLDGWAADDHAAAYATFLASCRAVVGSAKGSRDTRPVYPALVEICRKARDRRSARRRGGAQILRGALPRHSRVEGRRPERISHRLLRTDRRRLAHADRRLQGAALWPAARPRAHGAQAQGGELPQHRARGAPHRARQVRAVFRPRADRGRRARDRASSRSPI